MATKGRRRKEGRPSRALIMATRAQVMRLYSRGSTPERIAAELSMSLPQVEKNIKDGISEQVKLYARASPQDTFIRYAIFQLGIVDKLQRAYDSFMEDESGKQYGAAVNALRAQSDIMDKVLDRGIEYGVVTRRKADRSISMSKTDLRLELRREVEILSELLNSMDSHEQFQARRQAQLAKEKRSLTASDRQNDRKGLVKIRKVKRDSLGFITALRNDRAWMYKRHEYDEHRNIVKTHDIAALQRTTTEIRAQALEELPEEDQELLVEYEQRNAEKEEKPTPPPKQTQRPKDDAPTSEGYEVATQLILSE